MYTAYLVDDEELILDELIRTIPWMDNGFEVIGHNTSPNKALEEIEALAPDVVFSDLKMLGMDGNELIRSLKENGVEAEFVMISAYDSFENVRTFFQQSGFDYVLKPVNQDEMQIVLERLLLRLAEKKPQNIEDGDSPEAPGLSEDEQAGLASSNSNVSSIITYIDENFAQKITLDSLSKKFGFSKNYICKLLSKHYNTSLTCYLTKKRMEHAKVLLSDKTRLLKTIAIDCGYQEYFRFYKVFKAYYGVSPKEMIESF
jgi:YesN/AraC family two-component response regulator